MNKENVEYTYNGIFFSLKQAGYPAIWNNVDKPRGHYAKRNRPVTEEQILHVSTYMIYLN